MTMSPWQTIKQGFLRLCLPVLGSTIILLLLLSALDKGTSSVLADPIPPPAGAPKLSLSLMTVTPTLANTGGATLSYTIEIRNTGAYTAENAVMTSGIPLNTTYNNDASSSDPTVSYANGTVKWQGDVGFDKMVVVHYSVQVANLFSGLVTNTAVISQSLINTPVSLTAKAIVTDDPIFAIEKRVEPRLPGANKPMTYTLIVTNQGQPAVGLPITVTDEVPQDTQLASYGPDGSEPQSGIVRWTRDVTLDLGETTEFTFSVDVNNVISGTVIHNTDYRVESATGDLTTGEPHTVTVISPIFSLTKATWPDPPGSNREATYILTLLNSGSLATDLLISDTVPAGVTYVDGGTETNGVVSWTLPYLDSFESAEFTYTVSISDIADIGIVNDDFAVCSLGEGICQAGQVLTSVVQGPIFETTATLVPIAKKPGGGQVLITPTLTVHNVGNGNALNATVYMTFSRLSLTDNDISAFFADGSEQTLLRGPDCGNKCRSFPWSGDIAVDETITFTLASGTDLSSIGGNENDLLVASINVTDTTSNGAVFTSTAQAFSKITHFANVSVDKSAPPTIGPGQLLTYSLSVRNNGFTTDLPPMVTDVVPLSTTVVSVSHGGQYLAGSPSVVTWTLDLMGPGDIFERSFTVRVDEDLVSGTQIVNDNYLAYGYGNVVTEAVGLSGPPVTTTVREIGLIDSYKEVTPTLVTPGPGHVLTYFVHVVNSSPLLLTGVRVYDLLPWESSTYQRDAVVAAGQLISDIVSLRWMGSLAPYSERIITATVLVDPDFSGPITNTAIIMHRDLAQPVRVSAVAYVTDEPVLFIDKSASPDPVPAGETLHYTIRVTNLGQQATGLVITDVIPAGTTYVPASATAGGQLDTDELRWHLTLLRPGESRTVSFAVTAGDRGFVTNDEYGVSSAEGIVALGQPVITPIATRGGYVFLPLVIRR